MRSLSFKQSYLCLINAEDIGLFCYCETDFPAVQVLTNLLLRLPAGEIAVDCCLQTIDKRVPPKNIKQYIIQEAGKGCDISATV